MYVVAVLATVGISDARGRAPRKHRVVAACVAERHALEVESVAGERARLARDLHDVVAHHVSLVAVRAESAPFLHPDGRRRPRGPRGHRDDAREALAELRQVLVVLQRTSEGATVHRSRPRATSTTWWPARSRQVSR